MNRYGVVRVERSMTRVGTKEGQLNPMFLNLVTTIYVHFL